MALAGSGLPPVFINKSYWDISSALRFQGCPTFRRLWATLEEELSWATHKIHCDE